MPTVKYATDTQVRGAIARWRGNVSAAADELGIQPKNLRKRLETLGIDLQALRQAEGATGAGRVAPLGPSWPSGPHSIRAASPAPRASTGRQSGAGLSPPGGAPPNLRGVETAAAVAERDAPIKAVAPRLRPLRLRPASVDRLREAKLDVGARLRIETDENSLLNQFFDEAFEAWLAGKLGGTSEPEPASPGRKKK